MRLIPAVHRPGGIEYLVATVLRISLGEHHEFDIGRVTAKPAEAVDQVAHFVRRQRQAQAVIGGQQCILPPGQHVNGRQLSRLRRRKQHTGVLRRGQHCLCHAIVQASAGRGAQRLIHAIGKAQQIGAPALDSTDLGKPTVVRNLGGLAGPG